MIKLTMKLGSELIEVIVKDYELLFYDINSQAFTILEGIKISKSGVEKEFPDLKENIEWKKIALERLKKHIRTFKNEKERINYCKEELTKWGYEPLFIQREGFRPEKIK